MTDSEMVKVWLELAKDYIEEYLDEKTNDITVLAGAVYYIEKALEEIAPND